MSTSLEQSPGPSWKKRARDDLTIDLRDLKKPRHYYYRLESESSKASDDGTESVYSLQDKETDVVRDTSDTESKGSQSGDEFEYEFEYEVASLSENDGVEISTTDSEGMMIAAAAAVICDSSLEAWVTDVEDSDSSSDETSFGRTDFTVCVQCKGENCNPLYRYCEKCFQSCRQCNKRKKYSCFPLCQSCYKDRKKFFPPRPRRNRRKNQTKALQKDEPVKLDNLRSCLSGLSQDSGVGSSQECPSLGLDQIVVPEYLQSSGTSKSEEVSSTLSKTLETTTDQKEYGSPKSKLRSGKALNIKRKRQSSESSLSDFEVKKRKLAPELPTSDLGSEVTSSEVTSSSSFVSSIATLPSESSGFISERSSGGSISLEKSGSFGSDKLETELCMFCNSAPKDSIFLHTNIAHRCCCYPCAKKTLKSIKRCPICNRTVNKVVRIFTS